MEFIDDLIQFRQKTLFAVLIDPYKVDKLDELMPFLEDGYADLILIGGSSKRRINTDALVLSLQERTNLSIVVFPGHPSQMSKYADATMILSLLNSNNPKYIIGQLTEHSADIYKNSKNCFSVAYLLLNGGNLSSVERLTGTQPLAYSDYNSILRYSLAAQLLGYSSIYYEAGSGACNSVPAEIIRNLRPSIKRNIFVGGGIREAKQVLDYSLAGADVVVVGNIFEKTPEALPELYAASMLVNSSLS